MNLQIIVVLLFSGQNPFGFSISGEFFPRACDDYVSVSEDESVAFDVLGNDYFAGNNASITQFSKVRKKVP